MKKTHCFSTPMLYITMTLLLTGCEHKELCHDHPHTTQLQVVFDWAKAPDASPKSMSLYLFPQDGGKALRYEFAGHKGGKIRVPAGHYDALCLNSDTEGIYYRNADKRTTFEVTTRTTTLLSRLSSLGVPSQNAPRAEGTKNERVALEPDRVWSDHTENIQLKKATDGQSLTLYPEISIHTCTIEIRNAENLKYVSGVSASISTMAGGMLPGIGPNALSEERVTIPFGVAMSADKTTITGGIQSFGHCPTTQNSHKLVIYAVLADGSKWYYTYDVTEQFHTAPDPQHVHILLEKLPIPKPIVDGGGFDPSVDEWEDIEVDIEM